MLLRTYGGDHYSCLKVTVEDNLNGIVNEINGPKNRGTTLVIIRMYSDRNLNNPKYLTRVDAGKVGPVIRLCFRTSRSPLSVNERGFTCQKGDGAPKLPKLN